MGHRTEQLAGVGVRGRVEHLRRRARLDDLAALHHDDTVGEVGDHAHVVGDQQDARVDAVAQVADQLEDLRLHGDVEGRRRLVGDQHRRIAGQCLGDHRPLPLATRQLVRVGVDAPFRIRDLDEVEQFDHPLARQLRRHRLVAAQHLGDLEADRVHGLSAVIGSWKIIDTTRATHRAQRAHVEADDLQVAEADRPVHEGVLGQQAHHRQARSSTSPSPTRRRSPSPPPRRGRSWRRGPPGTSRR